MSRCSSCASCASLSCNHPTYSVGACPIGEQLGHSTRVTTYEAGNKHGYPAGSALCIDCQRLYPAVSAHPAVAATLRTLARMAAANNINEAPDCDARRQDAVAGPVLYSQKLDKGSMKADIEVYPEELSPTETYISPGEIIEPNFFAVNSADPRLLPVVRELTRIGFRVLMISSSSSRQASNEILMGRRGKNNGPGAVQVKLIASN